MLQTDLPGLLRAAECLKIKGLAVPDEAPKKEEPPVCTVEDSGGGGGCSGSEGEAGPPRKRSRVDSAEAPIQLSELHSPEPEQTNYQPIYSNQENGELTDIQVGIVFLS